MSSRPIRGSSPDGLIADHCCIRCRQTLHEGSAFTLGGARHCLQCAVQYRPMLRRSALTALVVGTLLVGINQGPALAAGDIRPGLAWQIVLTYAVPFCVASWGALTNSRS